jgi:hypothetical protein
MSKENSKAMHRSPQQARFLSKRLVSAYVLGRRQGRLDELKRLRADNNLRECEEEELRALADDADEFERE